MLERVGGSRDVLRQGEWSRVMLKRFISWVSARRREERPIYIAGWTYRHADRAAEAEARHIGPYGRKEIVSRPTRVRAAALPISG